MYKEKIIELAARDDVNVSDAQAEKLSAYMQALLEANEHINLTAVTEPNEFITRHLVDSLLVLDYMPEGVKTVLDVGTGGGFPGIPLAIMLPNTQFTLLDSTGKKLKVVERLALDLRLNNVTILNARAEEASRDKKYRDAFDCVVSRAVASLPILAELCLPFVKLNGVFIAVKGPGWHDEYEGEKSAIPVLGAKTKEIKELDLSDGRHEAIMILHKTKATPERFPRSFAAIKKAPAK